jgi:two-component sensor histidine kinase
VRSLITTAGEIAEGNLRARSEVEYDEHEIGELAAAMDNMADAIEETQAELRLQMEDNEVIAREMSHRLSNAMTLVQAIANQTIRYVGTSDEFKEAFGARIRALSAANQLLAAHDWKHTDLRELLEALLPGYGAGAENRIRFEGTAVSLDPRSATAVSMTVNELATNALKYGALSRPKGSVSLTWSQFEKEGGKWLSIEWSESGGPKPTNPSKKGFGSKMMRIMIENRLGGEFRCEFVPIGFHCKMSFALRDGKNRRARDDYIANREPSTEI